MRSVVQARLAAFCESYKRMLFFVESDVDDAHCHSERCFWNSFVVSKNPKVKYKCHVFLTFCWCGGGAIGHTSDTKLSNVCLFQQMRYYFVFLISVATAIVKINVVRPPKSYIYSFWPHEYIFSEHKIHFWKFGVLRPAIFRKREKYLKS